MISTVMLQAEVSDFNCDSKYVQAEVSDFNCDSKYVQAEVADFNCDSKCSGEHWADGSNSYPWFKHILPQIRDKK